MNQPEPAVSLIIPVKNEGKHIRNTVYSILQAKTNHSYEIVVVDDASDDGCCDFLPFFISAVPIKRIKTVGVGLARAKNIGAKQASAPYLIFCDAHVFVEDFWIERLLEPVMNGTADGTTPGIADMTVPNFIGCGQTLDKQLKVVWHVDKTDTFPTPVLPGGCMAISRKVFLDIGGFDSEFKVWGFEDIEISMRMWLFGYTCCALPSVKILHVFRTSTPYPLTFENVHFNMLRMAYTHFNEERIQKCKRLIQENVSGLDASVLASGALEQRQHYLKRRQFDDDWYMDKFSIPF